MKKFTIGLLTFLLILSTVPIRMSAASFVGATPKPALHDGDPIDPGTVPSADDYSSIMEEESSHQTEAGERDEPETVQPNGNASRDDVTDAESSTAKPDDTSDVVPSKESSISDDGTVTTGKNRTEQDTVNNSKETGSTPPTGNEDTGTTAADGKQSSADGNGQSGASAPDRDSTADGVIRPDDASSDDNTTEQDDLSSNDNNTQPEDSDTPVQHGDGSAAGGKQSDTSSDQTKSSGPGDAADTAGQNDKSSADGADRQGGASSRDAVRQSDPSSGDDAVKKDGTSPDDSASKALKDAAHNEKVKAEQSKPEKSRIDSLFEKRGILPKVSYLFAEFGKWLGDLVNKVI